MCPLEVELGPQSLPWLLLFILRNFVIVPGLLFKGIWAGEGGRNSAHLSDYEKAGVCRAGPAQGCSGRQVTEIIVKPFRADSSGQGAQCSKGCTHFEWPSWYFWKLCWSIVTFGAHALKEPGLGCVAAPGIAGLDPDLVRVPLHGLESPRIDVLFRVAGLKCSNS